MLFNISTLFLFPEMGKAYTDLFHIKNLHFMETAFARPTKWIVIQSSLTWKILACAIMKFVR